MKIVKIEELEVGDEIIISCQSYFKYLRILRKPAVGKKTHWNTGGALYKSVKCSTIRVTTQRSYTDAHGKTTSYDIHKWGWGPDDHNYNHYVDLEGRQIILVKQNND
jgi:hypothetical protein